MPKRRCGGGQDFYCWRLHGHASRYPHLGRKKKAPFRTVLKAHTEIYIGDSSRLHTYGDSSPLIAAPIGEPVICIAWPLPCHRSRTQQEYTFCSRLLGLRAGSSLMFTNTSPKKLNVCVCLCARAFFMFWFLAGDNCVVYHRSLTLLAFLARLACCCPPSPPPRFTSSLSFGILVEAPATEFSRRRGGRSRRGAHRITKKTAEEALAEKQQQQQQQ